MRIKRLIALSVVIAIVVFFTLPSLLFGEPDDNSTAIGPTGGQYQMNPNDADYSDAPEEAPAGEIMDVYCIDDDVSLTGQTDAYQETDTDVSDELIANGVGEVNAEGVEIMATTATGASNSDNQEAVWDIISNTVDTTPDNNIEKVVYAVMTLAEGFVALPENNDADSSNDTSLQEYLDNENVNEIDVTLDSDTLVDSNGDYNEFEATAIMENPLVPGITDQGKTTFWKILAGSYNVSFSLTDLVTETTSTMNDYNDGTDGDGEDTDGDGTTTGDHYGLASIPYYFYWWGDGYPEFEEMSVNIGACVDIDGDGMIDKEKGEDLDGFNQNANVVQTIVNPDYNPGEDSGPYNSQHIVETDGLGNVVTAVPTNVDIDYFNAGKTVVTVKNGSFNGGSIYEDVYIDTYWTGRYWNGHSYVYTGQVNGHWVNGAPSITLPAGYYGSGYNKTWRNERVTYPDPYDQRFVIESYSEPCDGDSETYSAWGSFELAKTDSETGGPVAGAVYKLTYISGQTNTPAVTEYTLTTGADGMASISGLPWGTYQLTEFSAPSGYSVDPNTYNVYIGGTALFAEGGSIAAGLEVENCPADGSITICKTDATNGAPLLGSTFQLWRCSSTAGLINDVATAALTTNGQNDIPGELVGEVTLGTDTEGNCYTWGDLPYGNYIVRELVAPQGYLVAPDVLVNLNSDNSDPLLVEQIADPRIPGRITVVKEDETGALMDGVGFTLYYKDSGNPVMPEKFTAGGLVTFDGLGWNTYIVKETTPPAGYDTSDPVEVTIDASNTEAGVTVTRIDYKTPPPPPGGGGEITVLGIQELPFTGMNPAIPISGISSIFAGGLMVMLSSLRRKLRRK